MLHLVGYPAQPAEVPVRRSSCCTFQLLDLFQILLRLTELVLLFSLLVQFVLAARAGVLAAAADRYRSRSTTTRAMWADSDDDAPEVRRQPCRLLPPLPLQKIAFPVLSSWSRARKAVSACPKCMSLPGKHHLGQMVPAARLPPPCKNSPSPCFPPGAAPQGRLGMSEMRVPGGNHHLGQMVQAARLPPPCKNAPPPCFYPGGASPSLHGEKCMFRAGYHVRNMYMVIQRDPFGFGPPAQEKHSSGPPSVITLSDDEVHNKDAPDAIQNPVAENAPEPIVQDEYVAWLVRDCQQDEEEESKRCIAPWLAQTRPPLSSCPPYFHPDPCSAPSVHK